MVNTFNVQGSASLNTNQLQSGVQSAQKSLRSLDETTVAMTRGLDQLSFALVGLGAGLAAGLGRAVGEFADFESSMRNVIALGELEGQTLDTLSEKVLDLSVAMARSPTELADSLYEIRQASFDVTDSFLVLEAAAAAATAGQTDMATTTKLLTSIINSYGYAASDVGKISDILFQTVIEGNVKFEDLGRSMSLVTPTANALGVRLEELGAAYASLTLQGLSTRQSTQALNGLFNSLLNPTKALNAALLEQGFASGQALVAQRGLGGALNFINDAMGGNATAVKKAVGVQTAYRATLLLNNEAQKLYVRSLLEIDKAAESGGSTQQFLAEQMKSTAFQINQAKTAIQAAGIELGATLAPGVNAAAQMVTKLAQGFRDLNPAVQQTIGVSLAAVSGLALFSGTILGLTSVVLRFKDSIGVMGQAFGRIGTNVKAAQAATTGMGTAARATAISLGVLRGAAVALLGTLASIAGLGAIVVVVDFIVNDPGERLIDQVRPGLKEFGADVIDFIDQYDFIGGKGLSEGFAEGLRDQAGIIRENNDILQVFNKLGVDASAGFTEEFLRGTRRLEEFNLEGFGDQTVQDFVNQAEEMGISLEEVILQQAELHDVSNPTIDALREQVKATGGNSQSARELANALGVQGEETEDLSARVSELGKKVSETEQAFRSAQAGGLTLPLTDSAEEFKAFSDELDSTVNTLLGKLGALETIEDPFAFLNNNLALSADNVAELSLGMAELGHGIELDRLTHNALEMADAMAHAAGRLEDVDKAFEANSEQIQEAEGRIQLVEDTIGSAVDGFAELHGELERGEITVEQYNEKIAGGEVVGAYHLLNQMLQEGRINQQQYDAIRQAGIEITERSTEAIKDEAVANALLLPEMAEQLRIRDQLAEKLGEADARTKTFVSTLQSEEGQMALSTAQLVTYLAQIGQIPDEKATQVIADIARANPDLAYLFDQLGLLVGPTEMEITANADKAVMVLQSLRAQRDALAVAQTQALIEYEVTGDIEALERAELLQDKVEALDGNIATVQMAADSGNFDDVFELTGFQVEDFEGTTATAQLTAENFVTPQIVKIQEELAALEQKHAITIDYSTVEEVDARLAELATEIPKAFEAVTAASSDGSNVTAQQLQEISEHYFGLKNQQRELEKLRPQLEDENFIADYNAMIALVESKRAQIETFKANIQADIQAPGLNSLNEAILRLTQRQHELQLRTDPEAQNELKRVEAQLNELNQLNATAGIDVVGDERVIDAVGQAADLLKTTSNIIARPTVAVQGAEQAIEQTKTVQFTLKDTAKTYFGTLSLATDEAEGAIGALVRGDLALFEKDWHAFLDADTSTAQQKVEMLQQVLTGLAGKTIDIRANPEEAIKVIQDFERQVGVELVDEGLLIKLLTEVDPTGYNQAIRLFNETKGTIESNQVKITPNVEQGEYKAALEQSSQASQQWSASLQAASGEATQGVSQNVTDLANVVLDRTAAMNQAFMSMPEGLQSVQQIIESQINAISGTVNPSDAAAIATYYETLFSPDMYGNPDLDWLNDALVGISDPAVRDAVRAQGQSIADSFGQIYGSSLNAQRGIEGVTQTARAADGTTVQVPVSTPGSDEAKSSLGGVATIAQQVDGTEASINATLDTTSLDEGKDTVLTTAQEITGYQAKPVVDLDTSLFGMSAEEMEQKMMELDNRFIGPVVGLNKEQFDSQMKAIQSDITGAAAILKSLDMEMNNAPAREDLAEFMADVDSVSAVIEAGINPQNKQEIEEALGRWEEFKGNLIFAVEDTEAQIFGQYLDELIASTREKINLQVAWDGTQAIKNAQELDSELLKVTAQKWVVDLLGDSTNASQAIQKISEERTRLIEEANATGIAIKEDPDNPDLIAKMGDINYQLEALNQAEAFIKVNADHEAVVRGLQEVEGARAEIDGQTGEVTIIAENRQALDAFAQVNNLDLTDPEFRIKVDDKEINGASFVLNKLVKDLQETFGPQYTAFLDADADGVIEKTDLAKKGLTDVSKRWTAFLRIIADDPESQLVFIQQRLEDLGQPVGINITTNADTARAVISGLRSDIDQNLIDANFVATLDANNDGVLTAVELATIVSRDFSEEQFMAEVGLKGAERLKADLHEMFGLLQRVFVTGSGVVDLVIDVKGRNTVEDVANQLLELNATTLAGKEVNVTFNAQDQEYKAKLEDINNDTIPDRVVVFNPETGQYDRVVGEIISQGTMHQTVTQTTTGTGRQEVKEMKDSATTTPPTQTVQQTTTGSGGQEVKEFNQEVAQTPEGKTTNLAVNTSVLGALATLITGFGLRGLATAINELPTNKSVSVTLTTPPQALLANLGAMNNALDKINTFPSPITKSIALAMPADLSHLTSLRTGLTDLGKITNESLAKTITIANSGVGLVTIQAFNRELLSLAGIDLSGLAATTQVFSQIGTAVATAGGTITTELGELSTAVSGFATEMSDSATEIGEGFRENVTAGLGGVDIAVREKLLEAAENIRQTGDQMRGLGKTVGAAFTTGIAEGMNIPLVYARAYAMAKAAYDATLDALQVGSPSRLMMKVGDEFVNGFAVGIHRKSGDAQREAKGMADKTLGYVRSIFQGEDVDSELLDRLPSQIRDKFETMGRSIQNFGRLTADQRETIKEFFREVISGARSGDLDMRKLSGSLSDLPFGVARSVFNAGQSIEGFLSDKVKEDKDKAEGEARDTGRKTADAFCEEVEDEACDDPVSKTISSDKDSAVHNARVAGAASGEAFGQEFTEKTVTSIRDGVDVISELKDIRMDIASPDLENTPPVLAAISKEMGELIRKNGEISPEQIQKWANAIRDFTGYTRVDIENVARALEGLITTETVKIPIEDTATSAGIQGERTGESFVHGVANTIDGAGPTFSEAFQSAISGSLAGFAQAWAGLVAMPGMENALSGVKTQIDQLSNASLPAIDRLRIMLDMMNTQGSSIAGTAAPQFEIIKQGLQSLVNGQMISDIEAFKAAVSEISGSFDMGATGMWFGQIATELNTAIPAIQQAMQQTVTASNQAGLASGRAYGTGVAQGMAEGMGAVDEQLSGIAARNSRSRVPDSPIRAMILDRISSAFDGVAQHAEQAASPIQSAGENIGTALTYGMASGTTRGSSEVANAIRAAMQNAINTARSTAGISSPSRVMYDMALDLMAGMSQGVNQDRTAQNAMTNQMRRMQSAIQQVSLADTLEGQTGGIVSAADNMGKKVGASFKKNIADSAKLHGNQTVSQWRKVMDQVNLMSYTQGSRFNNLALGMKTSGFGLRPQVPLQTVTSHGPGKQAPGPARTSTFSPIINVNGAGQPQEVVDRVMRELYNAIERFNASVPQ